MAAWLLPKKRAPQPGSIGKKWDKDELLRCGATGTAQRYKLGLRGEIHPVFRNWRNTGSALHKELEQPLLLASRLVENAGLEWVSDFVIDDIFDERYPGQENCGCPGPSSTHKTLRTVVRHHRAEWATPDLRRTWVAEAAEELRLGLARSIEWQLDANMFKRKGWTGYTCRHPRGHTSLDEIDEHRLIKEWDRRARMEGSKHRNLTLMLMTEYPERMSKLPKDSEEYLLTAFMTAITMVHMLGHAMFWSNFDSLTKRMSEPYYGADLEMGLGSSFVAHIFGGWVPVPIMDTLNLAQAPTFRSGIAWKQFLTWDYHRLRPLYRAHYSIPVEYVSQLFKQNNWEMHGNMMALLRPDSLHARQPSIEMTGKTMLKTPHAAAALADYRPDGEGWVWSGREGAPFRIPQYDGCVWPDIDLPIATIDVLNEPQAVDLRRGVPHFSRLLGKKTERKTPRDDSPTLGCCLALDLETRPENQIPRLQKNTLPEEYFSLQHNSAEDASFDTERCEITVEELKKRLSRLIGGSFDELDLLFQNF
ncbi:hypothetical protein BKA67DRAFT_529186 [Truncatella angustata]|uniref:Uncharacterized protein n=1 Tax=Truncatella angustata TaxID=152316 RepID=A0A9P9A2C6_9PEZI|nr:uncharacterized protein BKA67DRAFT_529186 [Truncatella angustata]KAH6658998.1 hypothetical protein BKA67DRAFT_529186 [Truncatella angustata]